MRIWIKDPLAILAEGATRGVVVENGRIAELVPAGGQPQLPVDSRFDAGSHVVLPGLVNSHHHFYQTLTRACRTALDKELFPWLTSLYEVWAGLTPDAIATSSRLALCELLLSGCTTAADHHYIFNDRLAEALDLQADAAAEIGMRVTLTRGSMDLSQKDGGLPPDSVVQPLDTILAHSEAVVGRWHDPAPLSMVQVALAPTSPFSVTPELLRESAALAGRLGVRLHTHLAETRDETRFCLDRFGKRPFDYLQDLGWIGPNAWFAHGIWFDDAEVARLGAAGAGIAHCPASNMLLASGFCRTIELEAAGAAIGLAVDGSASNDCSSLIAEARLALLLNRVAPHGYRVSHRDVLRWATEGSARCLGREDIGRLAPGCAADLALFRMDDIQFAGADDPLAALLLAGATRADRVMVAGRWLVEDGAIPGLDLPALMARQRDLARHLVGA
ncbi:8-oxoguanine deaminase [Marinibaculum pumilum]|uniref:8-oxoguanine deaminase n=1 Tax=Marinibaculum pumilum TaxID=1766165 RepID=A0ABV7LA46_9PROT